MKLTIFELGIKKIESNHRMEFDVPIKYDIFAEMKNVTNEEWEQICLAVNRTKFPPKIEDFIVAKKEIAKTVYNDDGYNYSIRCTKCDYKYVVKKEVYELSKKDDFICSHCRKEQKKIEEGRLIKEEENFQGRE